MISFWGSQLSETRLPLGTVWLLEALAEAKGRHALYEKQSPQILKALQEMALVESAESSNRIEGVTVERDRLRPLVLGNARPRGRSEEEIVGYRKALSRVHTTHEKIGVEPETIKRLHALAQGGTARSSSAHHSQHFVVSNGLHGFLPPWGPSSRRPVTGKVTVGCKSSRAALTAPVTGS